ncbi:MAG: hypothetical protein KGV44_08575 [Flavobacteriaceae bacterium]|nr:hypothetical protein [Flavobacteriaceae bacterium]
MKLKLFWQIHNERPYKRYYYQPLNKRFLGRGLLEELKTYARVFLQSAYLPFNPKYKKQLFEGERKSKIQMLFECLVWAFKYKEVCNYYFLYGLDLKSRKPSDYLAYTETRVLRNILNFRQRESMKTFYTFNYLPLCRDKFVFGQYAKSLNIPHPETIALVTNGMISWMDRDSLDYEDLITLKDRNLEAFCKVTTGENGQGAFLLKIDEGNFFINNKEVTYEKVREYFADTNYILQEKMMNHKAIRDIYPNAVNTIRLVTVIHEGEIVVALPPFLRTGSNGNVVDSAFSGGVLIGITRDGYLTDWAIRKMGDKLIYKEKHPDTGTVFAGLKIPYYDEMIETAKRFHSYYYGIPSMGWDIAITEDGPVFLEAGEDWEINAFQIFNGGCREELYKTHGKALDIKLRSY